MNNFLSKILGILTSKNRLDVSILIIIMFVGMILEMIGVSLVIPVVSILIQQDITVSYPFLQEILLELGNPNRDTLIIGVMLLLFITYLVKNLFLVFFAYKQARFNFNFQSELSQRLFTIYLRQPYTFHLQHNSALLVRNVRSEANMVASSVVAPIMAIIAEMMVLSGLTLLLIIVEPLGTIIVMFVFGLAALGFYLLTKGHVSRWGESRQYHDGLSLQHLNQGIDGAKEVKLLGRELEFLKAHYFHISESARMNQFQSTLQQIPRLWLELLGVLGLVTLVLVMINQEREISTILPMLGLFAAAAFRLMPSVNRILSAVQQLRYGYSSLDVLSEELSLSVEISKKNKSTELTNKIELNQLSYSYPGSNIPSLSEISFEILKGQTIGIIGPSGSGKSTLVDVVLGLLPPTDGVVKIDNQDIQLDLRGWQDQLGYVPQSIYLTDDSIRRNIAFGLAEEQIDNAAVNKAIKAAQLENYISSLPSGVDTIVGERGVRLSGGQRQRIGIARALYHDPDILVLDEATSALDNITEQEVMKAIDELHYSKTIIIVAHRLSTVENCDSIYKLEKGRVVAKGTPAEIIPFSKVT